MKAGLERVSTEDLQRAVQLCLRGGVRSSHLARLALRELPDDQIPNLLGLLTRIYPVYIGLVDGEKDLPGAQQSSCLLKVVCSISSGSDPLETHGWVEIQDHEQIGLWGKRLVSRHQLYGIETSCPLVSRGGKIVAVHNYDMAALKGRVDHLSNVLLAILNKRLNFLFDRKPSRYRAVPEDLPPVARGRLFRSYHWKPASLKVSLHEVGLGGLSTAVYPLNRDEEAGKRMLVNHSPTLNSLDCAVKPPGNPLTRSLSTKLFTDARRIKPVSNLCKLLQNSRFRPVSVFKPLLARLSFVTRWCSLCWAF